MTLKPILRYLCMEFCRFSTWRRRICQVAWALDDLGLASGSASRTVGGLVGFRNSILNTSCTRLMWRCASRSRQRLPAPRRNYILSKERAVAFDACSPGGFRRVDTGLLFVKSSPQEKERARARALRFMRCRESATVCAANRCRGELARLRFANIPSPVYYRLLQ